MTMKKFSSLVMGMSVLVLLVGLFGGAAVAQTQLTLSMRRDFGYSSGTGRIQGLFSLTVSGPDDLTKVIFLIDGETIGEDVEPPFKIQFDTGQYALGKHILSARGFTRDGAELLSNEISATFVSADEGMKTAVAIVLPLLGLVVGILLLSSLITMAATRRKGALPLGTPRNYGWQGGTICPKCGRPFALHFFKLNLGVGMLDFCPHCGKWSFVRHVPIETLRQAEARELEWAKGSEPVKGMSEEEKLRKELDDSRYQSR